MIKQIKSKCDITIYPQRKKISNVGKDVEQPKLSYADGGSVTDTNILENYLIVSTNTENMLI